MSTPYELRNASVFCTQDTQVCLTLTHLMLSKQQAFRALPLKEVQKSEVTSRSSLLFFSCPSYHPTCLRPRRPPPPAPLKDEPPEKAIHPRSAEINLSWQRITYFRGDLWMGPHILWRLIDRNTYFVLSY